MVGAQYINPTSTYVGIIFRSNNDAGAYMIRGTASCVHDEFLLERETFARAAKRLMQSSTRSLNKDGPLTCGRVEISATICFDWPGVSVLVTDEASLRGDGEDCSLIDTLKLNDERWFVPLEHLDYPAHVRLWRKVASSARRAGEIGRSGSTEAIAEPATEAGSSMESNADSATEGSAEEDTEAGAEQVTGATVDPACGTSAGAETEV